MKLQIHFPRDRSKPGTLLIPGVIAVPCLGKADNAAAARVGNPSRDPLHRNGDTPTGTYIATLDGPWSRTAAMLRSYGPSMVLRLEPTGGDALKAAENGRRGLAIHGGDLAADGRSLRPTHGCPRLSNPHQAALESVLKMSGEAKHEVQITERP